ncbi:MAG: DUF6603 domain-containing protein [Mycobacterium sp.]
MTNPDQPLHAHNWFIDLLMKAIDFLVWTADALADSQVRASVYADLGLAPPPEGAPAPATLPHSDAATGYLSGTSVEAEQMKAAIEEMRAIRQALVDILEPQQGWTAEESFDALLRLMSTNYVRLRFPFLYWLAQPLLLLDDAMSTGLLPEPIAREITLQNLAGAEHAIPQVVGGFFINLGEFIEGPIDYLKSLPYPPLDTEDDAQLISDIGGSALAAAIGFTRKKLVEHNVLKPEQIQVLYGWEPDTDSKTPVADQISGRMLSFSFASAEPDSTDHIQGSISATLALVPRAHGGPGLLVSIGGSGAVATVVDQWKWKGTISSASAFSITFRDDAKPSVNGPADAGFEFSLEHVPNPGGVPQTFDIGSVRVEFGGAIVADASVAGSAGDVLVAVGADAGGFKFRAVADKSAFVIDSGSHAVLERGTGGSHEDLRVQVGLGFGYAAGRFYIDGGSGLTATIPVTLGWKSLQFRSVTLAITRGSQTDQPPMSLEASTTVNITLGPVTVTLDRVGATWSTGGKDMVDFGLTAKGIGIVVKADGCSGGGYLFFDHTAHTYAGVFDLTIMGLNVKAVCLVVTEIDGRRVFSLMLIASATNIDWKLPGGFALTGFGIFVGIDRVIDLTALEAGVKTHALDSLMFPANPIANAPALVSAAAAAFPPSTGNWVGGAMVQISWGVDKLVKFELAVVVQGSGWSIGKWVVLGKARASLPSEKDKVVKVQADVILDHDNAAHRTFGYLTLNGTQILDAALSGEGAVLRNPQTFLFSLGGFNPRFVEQLPSDFPTLARLKMSLKYSDDIRMEASLYVAHTPHSTQFGGSFAVALKDGKFGVEGSLSIDALLQDQEPRFIVDLDAKFELKAWDVTLFLVEVRGTYAGRQPYHLTAKATFDLFIFSHTFSLDRTWGDATAEVQQAIDVSSQFAAALSDRSAWAASVPAGVQSLVTLRPAGGQPLLHPLGTIAVSQRVVPLGVAIDRFGSAPVQGANTFSIDTLTVGGATATTSPVQEQFVRSQYFTMSDDAKLSTPAFEAMDAGVAVPAQPLGAGRAAGATTQYRTLTYNAATGRAEPDQPYTPSQGRLHALAGISAAALAAASRGGYARYGGPATPVRVMPLAFVIASTDTMQPAPLAGLSDGHATTYTMAAAALRTDPQGRDGLQILPAAG